MLFRSANKEIGTIGRIVHYEIESLHHFEKEGLWLDPLVGNLQSYIAGENYDVVTNRKYEEEENNKKRSIFLPTKAFAIELSNSYKGSMSI